MRIYNLIILLTKSDMALKQANTTLYPNKYIIFMQKQSKT